MKNVLIALIVLALLGGGIYYYYVSTSDPESYSADPADTTEEPTDTAGEDTQPVEPDEGIGDGADPLDEMADETVLGTSAGGNDITAYHYGSGDEEVVFIGGIHGGYSYNTALLAFEMMDYFDANADMIPSNLRVTVIPVLNPDGLAEVTGTTGRFTTAAVPSSETARIAGRFNANEVDLNRNFDCQWQATGTWRQQEVSGGSEPFSEPEAAAVRDYVNTANPVGVVAYYSQAGGVYSSTCNNGIDPITADLTNTYADAADYPAYEEFDYYEITGDMVNWMAGEGIPAISVLLSDHQNTEWSKNRAGIEATLNYFAE